MADLLVNEVLELWEKDFNIIPLYDFNKEIPQWFIKKNQELSEEEIKIKWCKTPRVKWKNYQKKRVGKNEMQKWWNQYPNANIGILTEELVIIDADNKESVEWCERNTYSPVKVKTSKGFHFYFRKNPDSVIKNSSNAKSKLDIRAVGGYVVGAGSTHGTGIKYQWDIEPDFDFTTIDALPVITAEVWEKIELYLEIEKKSGASNPKCKRNINDKPEEGERNTSLSRKTGVWINQGHTEREAQGLAYKWNSELTEPLSEEEVKRTVKSIFKTASGKLNVLADHVLEESKAPDDFDFSRLPPLLKNYIKESGSITEANPVMILIFFLASFSVYIRHKAYFPRVNPHTEKNQWHGSDLHPNIWTLAIIKSGQFKTTALNIGAGILIEKERYIFKKISECKKDKKAELEKKRNILPNKGSCQGLFKHIEKTGGGLISCSEFGDWLSNLEASYNGSLKPTFTNWFDVPDFDSETTITRGDIILKKPYVSIAGVSTPQWIKSNMDVKKEIASGFFARFLLFRPPETGKRPTALPLNLKADKKIRCEVIKIFEFFDKKTRRHPLLFRLDENSKQSYEDCYNEIYSLWKKQEKDTQELLEPYVKRWPPYVLKLAMLIQPFIDLKSDIISVEALKAAYHIVQYAVESTVWTITNDLITSKFQEKAEKILKYIAYKGGELQRYKLISSRQLEGGQKEYDYVTDFLKDSGRIEETGEEKMNIIYRLIKS